MTTAPDITDDRQGHVDFIVARTTAAADRSRGHWRGGAAVGQADQSTRAANLGFRSIDAREAAQGLPPAHAHRGTPGQGQNNLTR